MIQSKSNTEKYSYGHHEAGELIHINSNKTNEVAGLTFLTFIHPENDKENFKFLFMINHFIGIPAPGNIFSQYRSAKHLNQTFYILILRKEVLVNIK